MVRETEKTSGEDNLLRVLIIEDYIWSKDIVRRMLEVNGYEVFRAESGEDGKTWAINNQPDVIIIDICLPFVDGYQVADMLKKNEETAHIPLIAFSTDKNDEQKTTLHGGFDGYIQKPVDINEFPDQVSRFITGQE